MRSQTIAAFLAASLAFASLASAHAGSRVWVNIEGGKLVTYELEPDTTYRRTRVFAEPDSLLIAAGTAWTTQFPGYQRLPAAAGGTMSGQIVGFDIAGPLLVLNGAGTQFQTVNAADAGGPTPPRRVDIEDTEGFGFTRTTSTGFVDGFDFLETIADGSHGHLAMYLEGAGTGTVAPNGIYALPLQLSSPSVSGNSETYYVLLGKGVTYAQLEAAKVVAEQTLVPEPTFGAVLLGGAALALLRRRTGRP